MRLKFTDQIVHHSVVTVSVSLKTVGLKKVLDSQYIIPQRERRCFNAAFLPVSWQKFVINPAFGFEKTEKTLSYPL